jgi:hypothetical protein
MLNDTTDIAVSVILTKDGCGNTAMTYLNITAVRRFAASMGRPPFQAFPAFLASFDRPVTRDRPLLYESFTNIKQVKY